MASVSHLLPIVTGFCDMDAEISFFNEYFMEEMEEELVRKDRRVLTRITSYYETTIPLYTPTEFRSHFRMGRDSVEELTRLLGNTGEIPTIHIAGLSPIETSKQVLIYLWYMATTECFRSLSDRFGVTISSTFRSVRRVTDALISVANDFIKWPDAGKQTEIKKKFAEIRGLTGVIGAVDGTHIMIRKPAEHPRSYLNRKKSFSFLMQAVCDADMLFTDVFVGWPGSVHDARVYRNSPLYDKLQELPLDSHILGDGAYPLSNSLITPYRDLGNLAEAELKFNRIQSSTRNKIECAFGLLKGKWRRLKYMDITDIKASVQTAFSSTVVHNFILIKEGSDSDDIDLEVEELSSSTDRQENIPRIAVQKREMLKLSLSS